MPAPAPVGDSSAAALAAALTALDVLDPLSAPLAAVTGEAAAVLVPRAAEPLAEPLAGPSMPATGWPCLECGTRNDFELSTCTGCGIAFGAPLRERAPELPGTRQTRLFAAVGAVVAVMAVIALLSALTGAGPTPQQPVGDTLLPIDQPAAQPLPPPNG